MPTLACEPSRLPDDQFSPPLIPKEALHVTWRGFQRQPRNGSWTRMRAFLHDVICGGNSKNWQALQIWMAQTLQYPEQKPARAVVLRGGRASGKSSVAKFFCEIVGKDHSLRVSYGSQLSRPFNAHLRDCLLLTVEEHFLRGDQAADRVLNDLITAPTLVIETSGKAPETYRNVMRVMILTDETWALPITANEGRYLVLDVVKLFEGDADAAEKRRAYFKVLHDEASNGGLEAMMADLLQLDIGQSAYPR